MGWIVRVELTTSRATIWRSNQLSYTHHIKIKIIGVPAGIRTPDLLLRRQLLYPTELQAHVLTYFQIKTVERVMGIEPTQSAWKAEILAIELHPHISCSLSSSSLLTAADLTSIPIFLRFVKTFFIFFIKNIIPFRFAVNYY